MRSIAIASMLLLTLTLSGQDLPDAATITKQVQEASKQRKSIEYVKELTGEVTLETHGGSALPVEVRSEHILRKKGAVYAQSADWGSSEAEGFILLYGMSSTLSSRINPRSKKTKKA